MEIDDTRRDAGAPYPQLAAPTLLVYRECVCGWWCATGEGSSAPICPECGGFAVPGGGPRGRYGPTPDTSVPHTGRRLYGLAFAAILGSEVEIMKPVSRFAAMFGFRAALGRERTERHYDERDCQLLAEEIDR